MIYAEWLYRLQPEDSPIWGDRSNALAKVARLGVPVVPSFVISPTAIQDFYLQPKLKKTIEKFFQDHPTKDAHLVTGVAKDIRAAIIGSSFPTSWRKEIYPFIEELEHHLLLKKGGGLRILLSTVEGAHVHTQIGMVKKWEDFLGLFKALLVTRFTPTELQHRLDNGLSIMPALLPLLVQVHPEAQASGFGQQYDPKDHDAHTLYLTAHYHEHTNIRSDETDIYRYDRSTLLPLSKKLGKHRWATGHEGEHQKPNQSGVSILDERQQMYLAKIIKKAQSAFESPMRFEWVLINSQLFLTSAQRVQEGSVRMPDEVPSFVSLPLAFGSVLNLGCVSGVARVLRTKSDWERLKPGDIAVVSHLKTADREKLVGVAGIVSEVGHGVTPEASLAVSLGVPAVGGILFAQELVKEGQLITVDGTHGILYEGRHTAASMPQGGLKLRPVTGTHVSVLIPDPLHVSRKDLQDSDGVGLFRGEFLLELAGVHPQHILNQNMEKEYGDILEDVVEQAARAAYPYPMRYQLHDIHPGSAAGKGLRQDRHEPNPKLGYRGAHRLLQEPELVKVELEALAKVVKKGFSTIELVLPMVRHAKEARLIENLIQSLWPSGVELPKIWARCETPAMAISADDLCDGLIYGVYFDVPALAQFISGIDDTNYQVAHHLDQADSAVLDALHYAIATCRSKGVRAVILAEGDELHAAVIAEAIRSGATEVAVSPAEVGEVREILASIEQRLLIDHVLEEIPVRED